MTKICKIYKLISQTGVKTQNWFTFLKYLKNKIFTFHAGINIISHIIYTTYFNNNCWIIIDKYIWSTVLYFTENILSKL